MKRRDRERLKAERERLEASAELARARELEAEAERLRSLIHYDGWSFDADDRPGAVVLDADGRPIATRVSGPDSPLSETPLAGRSVRIGPRAQVVDDPRRRSAR